MKQIDLTTCPTVKIYVEKDAGGSYKYFGSPSMELINADFENLADEIRRDYSIRKQIL
jgi:hypothetical protein